MPANFNTLSPWIVDPDGQSAYRVKHGEDPSIVKNRIAFIEKTPRVRLSSNRFALETSPDGNGGCSVQNKDAWYYGPKGSSPEYGNYLPSREWCDQFLHLIGYDLLGPTAGDYSTFVSGDDIQCPFTGDAIKYEDLPNGTGHCVDGIAIYKGKELFVYELPDDGYVMVFQHNMLKHLRLSDGTAPDGGYLTVVL